MALCSFSSELVMDNYTIIDNIFINDYLPSAPEYCVKVYLYGLSLCSNPKSADNALDSMAKVLHLTEQELQDAFLYWQNAGLVQMIEKNPLEVKYLPIKAHSASKKYQVGKYADFNKQVQSILSGRMIQPREFEAYYDMIETYHFEPEALVMLIRYCVELKGESVNYPYIIATAKNYVSEGITTTRAIDERFMEMELASKELKMVLKALGISRTADPSERNLYIKWTKQMQFPQGVIIETAKSLNRKGGMYKLDEKLSKYYELKLFTVQDIEAYTAQRDSLYATAREICSNLGLFYQSLDAVVDTYVLDWFNKGYEKDALLSISKYCFKHSLRTLEAMDKVIQKWYELGIVSTQAIIEHLQENLQTDKAIQKVLDTCGILRNVNSWDRSFYRTWTYSWKMEEPIILYCAELAKGKTQPMQYVNKLLTTVHEHNWTTLPQVQKGLKSFSDTAKPSASTMETRATYNAEDLDKLLDSFGDDITT